MNPLNDAEMTLSVLCGRTLENAYREVRAQTEALAVSLSPEDQGVQSMPDASPTKWHLAHTTWFFETFVLALHQPGYAAYRPRWSYLFNSYYDAVGERHPRAKRGMLTRPSVGEVMSYRAHVDVAIDELLAQARREQPDDRRAMNGLITLGLHHEQQHQELLLTDILHAFSCNPLAPAYHAGSGSAPLETPAPLRWLEFDGGIFEIGATGADFAFDNEMPRHQVLLRPFRLASRLVCNAEWQSFIDNGGYRRPELWLADGWTCVQAEQWSAPLYWRSNDGGPYTMAMSLRGEQPIDPASPVTHISFYEADAFARWSGKRLPSEAEWEVAAAALPIVGNFLGTGVLSPRPAPLPSAGQLQQMFGDVWEWTHSPYAPYPGFFPAAGAIGEYNAKFMCNQMVLRGGSCVTPDQHIRASYRNFFYPHQRWQFTGLRLAEDL